MQHLVFRTYTPTRPSRTPIVYDHYSIITEDSRTLTFTDVRRLLKPQDFFLDDTAAFLNSPSHTTSLLCSAPILTPKVLLELVPELFL